MDKKADLTSGKIWKQLLFFFFPILIGTFFQQLYNTVDTIIVGRYVGTEALAAVGSTGNLTNLIINFFMGLSSGATVVIAQYYGARDEKRVSLAVHTSMALSIVCGIVMMLFGLLFSYQCLELIGVPHEILNDASLYMRLYFLSMIPGVVYNIGAGILRAVGDSKTPLYYLIVCSFVNVIFDIILVVYMHIGIAGAAIATTIAQLVCGILVVIKLMRTQDSYQLHLHQIAFDKVMLKKIVKIGVPAGIQSTMYSISNIVLQTRINSFGTNTIASWAVYVKVDAMYWMISGAFGSAITTFVGQNYGAKLYDRVKHGMKTCMLMDFVASIIMSLLIFVFGGVICQLFSTDINIINETYHILKYLSPFYFAFVCVEILSGMMRGCGDSFKPMMIVCLGVCVFRILWVAFVSPFFTSFDMVIVSYPITWILTSILFLIYYKNFHKNYLKEDD